MNAMDAIRTSRLATMYAHYARGIALVHRSDDTGEFTARIVARDADGELTFDGLKVLGTFQSVDESVQALESDLETSLRHWEPGEPIELRLGALGSLHPAVSD